MPPKIFLYAGPPPPPELHIRIVKIKISCTRVHGFEEKSKFHVPRYMDLKKKQNSMYLVHESEKTKSWDILKKRGWHGAKNKFCFVSFFEDPKK